MSWVKSLQLPACEKTFFLNFSTSTFLATGLLVVTNMDMATVRMAYPQSKREVSQKAIITAVSLKQARNCSLSSAGDPVL